MIIFLFYINTLTGNVRYFYPTRRIKLRMDHKIIQVGWEFPADKAFIAYRGTFRAPHHDAIKKHLKKL